MAEFAEVVFGHIGGLTSYLSWGNVRMFAVTLGVLWAVHIVNQKVGILSLVGSVGARLFGARVEGLKVKGGAVAAEKSGDWLTAGLHYDQLGDLDKALDCYEKAGEYHLAGESFARQVQELNAGSSHYGAASHVAELARLSHRAGRCFEKAGETARAPNSMPVRACARPETSLTMSSAPAACSMRHR